MPDDDFVKFSDLLRLGAATMRMLVGLELVDGLASRARSLASDLDRTAVEAALLGSSRGDTGEQIAIV